MEIIASHDLKDSTSVPQKDRDFTSALVEDVRGMRIGIPRDYFGEGLDDELVQKQKEGRFLFPGMKAEEPSGQRFLKRRMP